MGKLETLVVPEELGIWLEDKELGEPCYYFTVINKLANYWDPLGAPLGSFITQNKKELIEVILGSREYRTEEPLYYALVKGHEVIASAFKYWNFNTLNSTLFVNKRKSTQAQCKILTEMSKSEWNKIGINEDNADFVKVEEMEG